MFTQVRSANRRVSPEAVGQRALMRVVYVVLEPQYQNALTTAAQSINEGNQALAMAGWLAGLEPVRLEISGSQLVLEAGIESRWLLANLASEEAEAAAAAFREARGQAGGLQFIAVQASEQEPRFEGFWLLRDLPDP